MTGRRLPWVVLATVFATALGACGGREPEANPGPATATVPSGGAWTEGDPTPPPQPSTDPGMREIDWTGFTTDAEKVCSGAWEYDPPCCATNWQYGTCSYAQNGAFGTLTKTEYIQPTSCGPYVASGCAWECPPELPYLYSWCSETCSYACGAVNPNDATMIPIEPPATYVCNFTRTCNYPTTSCGELANNWKNTYPSSNLDLRSGITATATTVAAVTTWRAASLYGGPPYAAVPATEPSHAITCNETLQNAPLTVVTGQNSACGYDKTKPLAYGACGATYAAGDLYAPTLCSNPKAYTAPGLSRQEALTGATVKPKMLADSRYPVSCTTCEDKLFGATTNPAADAQAKYACLTSRLAETYASPNLLPNGSLDVDTNADGVPDGWAVYNNGAAAEPSTQSIQATGGVDGGKFYRISWTVANTTTKGLYATNTDKPGGGVQGGWRTGVWYTVSWYAKASDTNVGKPMLLGWNNGPQQSVVIANPGLTTAWQRYALRFMWDAGAAVPPNRELWISIAGNSGTSGSLDLDQVQVEEGTVATAFAARPNGAPARGDLRNSLVGHAKLVLEYKGNVLTADQRANAAYLYQTYPSFFEPAYASGWSPPATPIPAQTATKDFDGTNPLQDWSTTGSVTIITPYWGAKTRCASLGATTTSRTARMKLLFTLPAAASQGTVSFSYRMRCAADAADYGQVTLEDLVTGQQIDLLGRQTCATATTGFETVSSSIQSVCPQCAGHRVALTATVVKGSTTTSAVYLDLDNVTYTYGVGELDGDIAMCNRMTQTTATPDVLRSALPDGKSIAVFCVDAIGAMKALPTAATSRQQYLDGMRDASVAILQKLFAPEIAGATAADRKSALQGNLWMLGRWYDQAKSGVYVTDASGSAQDKLLNETSVLAGTIWKSLYKDEITAMASTAKTDEDVAAHLGGGMATDREMLSALHSNYASPVGPAGPPLQSAPALYFLSDSFRTMSDRLTMFAPYHDLGCRFLDCAKSGTRSQTTALTNILGSVSDATALRTALTEADQLKAGGVPFTTSWTEWRDALELVQTQHAVLERAVRDATPGSPTTYTPALLTNLGEDAYPPLAELGSMVQSAAKRSGDFGKTGLLLRRSASGLPTGLLEGKLAQVQNSVVGAQSGLLQRIAEYRGTRAQLATSLIQEIQTEQTRAAVDSRLQQAALRMTELSEDDENLKVSGSIDAERFSQQGKHYEDLMRQLEALGNALMLDAAQLVAPAAIPGAGRFSRGAPILGIDEVAVVHPLTGQYWKVHGETGDVVNLSVTGKWAPTCALQALNGSFQGIPVTGEIQDAQTGPEGYEFTYSGSSFSARSSTRTRSRGWSLGAAITWSAGLGNPAAANPLTGAIQATASYSMSDTRSTSTTTGTESRSTAAFQLGLRFPNTPFPEFPAGSLLAVQVTPGATNPLPTAEYDIQVVQAPYTTVVFSKPADLYLVVNDLACATYGSGNLSIETTHLVPAAVKMAQLGQAMQAAHESFRAQADTIIQQGRILPSQMAAMREQGWQELRVACACDLAPYPEAVKGFFGTWIDSEIVHIEREVELIQIHREMAHQLLDAISLRTELEATSRMGRYARMLPLWSLRNLTFDNEYVRDATDHLARVAAEELYPFIHLRYQDVLDGSPVVIGLLSTDRDKLERLLALDWKDDTLDTVATRVVDATTALSNKLAEVIEKDKASCPAGNSAGCNVTVSRAVVRFPNPYRRPFFEPWLPPPGRAADEVRSAAVWDAINAYFTDAATAPPIRIKIVPEDLYGIGTTNASIGCKSAAPVVRAMALYVVTSASNADTLNRQEVRVPTWPGQEMEFTGVGDGIETYRFDNNDWLVPRDRVLYGEQVDALGTFLATRNLDPYAYSEGTAGISPIDSFEFAPLMAWGDPNLDSTELMLIFELESRTRSTGVKGVDTCRAPTTW